MKHLFTFLLLTAAIVTLAVAVLIRPRVGHPVTPWMSEAAATATGRSIPPLPDSTRVRPTLLIFILPGCPCSDAYEPYTHTLFRAYGTQANFVGVVAGTAQEATDWQRQHKTPFPIIADADRSLARSYGAERSAYTALVLDGKTVRHLWPGYSEGMLRDLGAQLASATGTTEASLHLPDAPKTLTSGCSLSP